MTQTEALNILKAGHNVYLTGAAGSGKTHVLNEYISYLKDRGVAVGITASTGIAATHLGGVTIHSWSGIGVRDSLSDRQLDEITGKEYLWKRVKKARVLIIDEISMLHPRTLDMIERVCREMKQRAKPFGGMQVVLAGDFFQLPPIVRDGSAVQFVPQSNAWNTMNIRVCYLQGQYRQKDNALEQILNEMRTGDVSNEARELLRERHVGASTANMPISPTRLYTHNIDVDALNEKELKILPGKETSFAMITKGRALIVATLKKSVLAPEILCLKKNAKVMFVKNNFEEGYVNGTLGVIEDIEGEVPMVRTFKGRRIPVHAAEWVIEENGKVLARVEQLPLRLAWAITVHKSQGMSMDAADIDLSKSFVPGQGYVALSRLISLSGLILRGVNEMAFAVHPDVAAIDIGLQSDSEKWRKAIVVVSDKDMQASHQQFIRASGGTNDIREIEKYHARGRDKGEEKISTYEKTRLLLAEGLVLREIADKRGMTHGTIIGHFERLRDADPDLDLNGSRPKQKDFDKIAAAFLAVGDTRLAPVYGKLKGVYSYEDIRLARLFFDK